MSTIDLWYVARATGIAALVLLTATVVLGVLVAGRASGSLPSYARAELHSRVTVLTIVFLVLHVGTILFDTYVHISWTAVVLPFTSNYHTVWLALGTISVDFFLAVAISSAVRQHLPARIWRLAHWSAYLSWPVAVAHTLGMGTDMRLDWVLGLVAACIASVVGVVVWRISSALRTRASTPSTRIAPRRSLRPGVVPKMSEMKSAS